MEDDLRRARRARWAFRLIFYPGAVIVALLLLAARSTAGGEGPTVSGETSQRRPITLHVSAGHVTRFLTTIDATCPGGGSYPYTWTADYIGAGGHVREQFARRSTDGTLVTVDLDMRARVDDGVVTGTLRMVDKRPYGFDCDSGAVSFSARAD